MYHAESVQLRSVEAARALAALSVALMHAANLMRVPHFSGHVGLGGLFDFGYTGVDFFFVLSGFIITYTHAAQIGQPTAIPRYLWRRFTRIYPIFWIILGLAMAVLAMGRLWLGKAPDISFSADDFIHTFLLIQTSTQQPKYLGVAWSLQYEVFFYAVFALLLWSRRIGYGFGVIWFAAIVAHWAGWLPDRIWLFTAPHCLQFMLGIGVGLLVRTHTFPSVGRKTLVGAFVMVVLAVIYEVDLSPARHGGDGRLVLGVASAFMLFTLVELEKQRAIDTPEWLCRMGAASYSIYLGHILLINLTYSILLALGVYHRLPEVVVYGLGLTCALTGTLWLGLKVERPLVAYLKQRGPKEGGT